MIRVLVLALATGCMSVPDHRATAYACDKDPRCPDGFSCVEGVCTQDIAVDPGMVLVPGDGFTMGCTTGSVGCGSDASVHTVMLTTFTIDEREVSQADYKDCVAQQQCSEANVTYDSDPTLPMRNINWMDASAFCAFKHHKLPTEAQWERAVRVMDQPFPWGVATPTCSQDVAAPCPGPVPVDTPSAGDTPSGIHHMLGNVREWIDDQYDATFYGTPLSLHDPDATSGDPNQKVVRGGSFMTAPVAVWTRDHTDKKQGYPDVGFRCAK